MSNLVPAERIESCIYSVRGQKVMLDEDLARLYGVEVKRLNEQVRRNAERFPPEFMFQLTGPEVMRLKSQSATAQGWGGRRYLPHAFTEHGAVMLATVLNSPAAVAMSIQVVKAFVLMRRMVGAATHLARKLDALERKMINHDGQFAAVFKAIRQLMERPDEEAPPKGRMGFHGRNPSPT